MMSQEPVRYSKECAMKLKNTEAMLRDTMESQDIEQLKKAIEEAQAVQVGTASHHLSHHSQPASSLSQVSVWRSLS